MLLKASDLHPRPSRNRTSRDRITLTGGGYPYDIGADDLRTPADVLHWVAHLAPKRWVTTSDIADVITFAWDRNGVNPYERG